MGQNVGLQGFHRMEQRAIWLWTYIILWKREEKPEGNSKIIRNATPTRAQGARLFPQWSQRARLPPLFLWAAMLIPRGARPPHVASGVGLPSADMGVTLPPTGPREQSIEPKRIVLKVEDLMAFDLLGSCYCFLISNFSLSEWKCLPYACATAVFWKHTIHWVSQLHSRRAYLSQEKSYFSSHPYPI